MLVARGNDFACVKKRSNCTTVPRLLSMIVARKYDIEHLVKQLTGQRTALKKLRHLNELTDEPAIWSCDTGQWLSCFDSCQLTIL